MTTADLRQLELIRDVPPTEMEELARASRWEVHQRHATIAGPEEEDQAFYVVADGLVGIVALCPHEYREFIPLLLSPHDLFSLRDLPTALGEITQARALSSPTIVYRLPAPQFVAAKRVSPGMQRLVEQQTKRYLHTVLEALLDFVFYDAPTRLARTLGRLAVQSPDSSVWLTHEELGMLTGLKRQKVTEYLGNLVNRGLIVHAPYERRVAVPDPIRLIQAATTGFQLSQR